MVIKVVKNERVVFVARLFIRQTQIPDFLSLKYEAC